MDMIAWILILLGVKIGTETEAGGFPLPGG